MKKPVRSAHGSAKTRWLRLTRGSLQWSENDFSDAQVLGELLITHATELDYSPIERRLTVKTGSHSLVLMEVDGQIGELQLWRGDILTEIQRGQQTDLIEKTSKARAAKDPLANHVEKTSRC